MKLHRSKLILCSVLLASGLFMSSKSWAQTNGSPVRLAIISESGASASVADLLTVELSSKPRLHMLERAQIEKVYREQGLSAANQDFLRLGQVLGADGLLLLTPVSEGTNQFMQARLVAVKPGVILASVRSVWPVEDATGWVRWLANHFDPLFPKLGVLAKDALPISVVNLRAAVKSAEEEETERQLTVLAIERLTHERELFVLERRRMELLSAEKELKGMNESAFWNGSYLLDGVIDRDGYSKETVTIHARLSPPNGGTPMPIEISGSRTNLAVVINQLVGRVMQELKLSPHSAPWSPADEAAQYFEQAKWALKWHLWREAQAASEASWALGKKDLACALLRVKSYLSEASSGIRNFDTLQAGFGPDGNYDAAGNPRGNPPTEAYLQAAIKSEQAAHPLGLAYEKSENVAQRSKSIKYVFFPQPPAPKNLTAAQRALDLYYEFSRPAPDNEPKIISPVKGQNYWNNSEWYQLGIDTLVVSSRMLQQFHCVPPAQRPAAEKLAKLRATTRAVAGLISSSPSIHEGYFGEERFNHVENLSLVMRGTNIFRCAVQWGCYWQERPEDTVALYGELMTSSVFAYIHDALWTREIQTPRLVAWNEEDQKRLPALWENFVQASSVSTNWDLQFEGRALKFRNVKGKKDPGAGWAALATERQNRETERKRLEGEQKKAQAFEKQKQYLQTNSPVDLQEFFQLFVGGFKAYSPTQAREILPLLAAYRSNLVAQAEELRDAKKHMARLGAMQVARVEADVNRILNPPAPTPATPSASPATSQPKPPPPAAVAKPTIRPPAPNPPPGIVTNVLVVKKFLEIPLDRLTNGDLYSVTFTAHHWMENKLLLDFTYAAHIYAFDDQGNWRSTRTGVFPTIALLDPATERWEIIPGPEVNREQATRFYSRSALSHGDLFTCDEGQIKKYDYPTRRWQVLAISDGNNYGLFTFHGHLYAAGPDMIFEILDGGKSTRILASTRRNPPVSTLDREELGNPVLFAGPDHALRVSLARKIFTWAGNDWREDSLTPPSSCPPEVFPDALLFRLKAGGVWEQTGLSRLLSGSATPELCVSQKHTLADDRSPSFTVTPANTPLWKMPPDLNVANLPATLYRSNLFLLIDHYGVEKIMAPERNLILGEKILAQDGYHAQMLCFSPGLTAPQKTFLRFESPQGSPPVSDPSSDSMFSATPPAWLFMADNRVFFGLDSTTPLKHGNEPSATGYKPGVWMMSFSQIEPGIAAQKQIQLAQLAEAAAATNRARQVFVRKYDRDHNGTIDADETETALNDPAFIEANLSAIDTNQNCRLDLPELTYFDANTNKILEAKEQVGIDLAHHLLTAKRFQALDVNGDGLLDMTESAELRSDLENGARDQGGPHFPDQNRDGQIDLAELESVLKQRMRAVLDPRAFPPGFHIPRTTYTNQPADVEREFKTALEAYWRDPGSITNRPPVNGIPPGRGIVTNGIPGRQTP